MKIAFIARWLVAAVWTANRPAAEPAICGSLASITASSPLCIDAYTAVSGASEDGYAVLQHIESLVDGKIIWAPASAESDHPRRRF